MAFSHDALAHCLYHRAYDTTTAAVAIQSASVSTHGIRTKDTGMTPPARGHIIHPPSEAPMTTDASVSSTRTPLCYAHRGARGHAPENTLLAFELAFDLGAEGIECDVQRSRDDQLLILHDGTV